MKKAVILTFMMLVCGMTASAQRSVDAVEKLFQKRHAGIEDVRTTFATDLSHVWKNNGYIGFIGANYQRLDVNITEVSLKENQTYELTGNIESPTYTCDFTGELLVLHIYPKPATKADHIKGEQIYDVFGVYQLKETGKKSGRFEGFVMSELFTQDGRAYLCGWDDADDGYRNNQFEGVWISDDSGLQKEANWGIGRIPDSGDLDVGERMFQPAEKYWKNGWETYERDAREEARQYMETLYTNEGVIDDHLSWRSWADLEGRATTTLYCDGEPVRIFRPYHDEDMPSFMTGAGDLTYVDANFDQYPDVLICLGTQGSRHFLVYECYLYDPASETYQLAKGFDAVIEPTFDNRQKAVYGCGQSSYDTIEHERYEWHGNRIVETSFVTECFDEENKPVSYSEGIVIIRGDDIEFSPVHENVPLGQLSQEWQEHIHFSQGLKR